MLRALKATSAVKWLSTLAASPPRRGEWDATKVRRVLARLRPNVGRTPSSTTGSHKALGPDSDTADFLAHLIGKSPRLTLSLRS